LQVLARDGILISCSCSHHLATEDLVGAIQQSARHVDRFAQIVEVGNQAPRPSNPSGDCRKTRYLKSLVCRVIPE
jgi:23S rRNA (cytosine1962-C5)-methyltransferase